MPVDVGNVPLWIAAIAVSACIALGLLAVAWMRRHGWRVREVGLFAGPMSAKFVQNPPDVSDSAASTKVSRNKFWGHTTVKVIGAKAEVTNNVAVGTTKITVADADALDPTRPKKPKTA